MTPTDAALKAAYIHIFGDSHAWQEMASMWENTLAEMRECLAADTDKAAADQLTQWTAPLSCASKIRRYFKVPESINPIEKAFDNFAAEVDQWASRKGWNEYTPSVEYDISKLGLMVTEIAEAIEARRHGDPRSDHIPEFTGQEEELADCIIRIAHYAFQSKLRVGAALTAKMAFNEGRPYKHGKQA